MDRILVPIDGSLLAEQALTWADELGGSLDAEVELLRVLTPEDIPQTENDQQYYQQIEELTKKASQNLAELAPRLKRPSAVHTTVLQGSAAEVIAAHAHTSGATLILMSSHGRSGMRRMVMGSVAGAVVRESPVPVLVVRSGTGRDATVSPQTVLVPLDGSELSEAMLLEVAPLAKRLSWTLILLWVAELPRSLPVQGGLIPLNLLGGPRPDMTAYLDGVAADLSSQGIATDLRVWAGDPAHSIVEFAASHDVGMIALSTHGRQGIGRWVLGGVAEFVLSHASVPVIVVRPAAVPMGSALAAHLSLDRTLESDQRITLSLTERQGKAVRLALEHLAWSSSRHDGLLEDVRGALAALDAAQET